MKSAAVSLVLLLLHGTIARGQEIVAETPKNTTPVDATPIVEAPITEADRAHWAFAPIKTQPLPTVKTTQWLHTAVDAFILDRLEANGIEPSKEANRPTLLRRLSFDLIGLPPTPEELAAFENDPSPDAYERQVDRLLASPALGERWGQYWLDLARFAETDGYEHDKVRPNAWRYRDWVIGALNADLPYDQFVRLQLAGDETEASSRFKVQSSKSAPQTLNLEPGTLNSSMATIFCLAGPDMPDVNDQIERRHVLLNETTATVGASLLGLQLGCAQCHNHKYDPISQADFYRLRAVFEPAVATLKRDVPFNVLANQKDVAPARLWVRGDHRRPGLEVPPAFPRIADVANASHSAPRAPRSALADWLVQPSNPLTSRVMANRIWQHHFGRGICVTPSDFGVMGGPVTHPELLDWLAVELREGGWTTKRMHRMIVSSATYREISDFRFQISDLGAADSNLKSEIRNLKSDTLYGHFPRRRLEGEAIRDAMLAAAGLLSCECGGPGVMPPLPDELVGTLLKGQWTASKREADHYKRSVYVFARRNLRYPIFEAFDRPDGNATCPLRNRSTTAPQSLLLFNSEFSLLAARHLAGRILGEQESKNQRTEEPKNQGAGQIERLYLIALSRRPTASELTTVAQFVIEQRDRLAAEGRPREQLALPVNGTDSADAYAAAALVDACLAILNSNEFIYVD